MASGLRYEYLEHDVPFEAERRIANEIMMAVNRLQLPLKLN